METAMTRSRSHTKPGERRGSSSSIADHFSKHWDGAVRGIKVQELPSWGRYPLTVVSV